MQIKEEAINTIAEAFRDLLTAYEEDLNVAWGNAGDDPFQISLGTKLKPDKGRLKIETSISFVKERIKDKRTDFVEDAQMTFLDEATMKH